MEHAELGAALALSSVDLLVRGPFLPLLQGHVAVLPGHPRGDLGRADGTDAEGGRGGVLEHLAGLQHRLTARDPLALHDVLHAAADGLDLEPPGKELDDLVRVVRYADRVLEAVLPHGRVGVLGVVTRRDLDRQRSGRRDGALVDGQVRRELAPRHVRIAG